MIVEENYIEGSMQFSNTGLSSQTFCIKHLHVRAVQNYYIM
jgi:hypothetical protein